MILWSWAAAATEFAPVSVTGDCAVSMRPPEHAEGAAMRAECDWVDVDADALIAMLSVWEDYPRFVFPVDEARIVREEPGRSLVYQRQAVFGLADREVLLWMRREDVVDGVRFAWETAADEPLDLRPGAIRTPKNVGYWEVTRRADGVTHVVHEIALDAGGSIPKWVVELVRYRSFAKILQDVRGTVP